MKRKQGTETLKQLEFYCEKLSEISKAFPVDSDEYNAISAASIALMFAMPHRAFSDYREKFSRGDLSAAQLLRLESFGIEIEKD